MNAWEKNSKISLSALSDLYAASEIKTFKNPLNNSAQMFYHKLLLKIIQLYKKFVL